MKASQLSRYRRLWPIVGVTVGVVALYITTIGLVPAIERHAADGRLQWLRSVPGAMTVLEMYEWPASGLYRLPGMCQLIDLSEEFWCGITHAPDTTP
jgi:hypothetical protein